MTQPEYRHGQNDPGQEPPKEEMTLGEALRAIAERTAFRTEYERDQVYAAIDRDTASEPADTERDDQADEPDDKPDARDDEIARLRAELDALKADRGDEHAEPVAGASSPSKTANAKTAPVKATGQARNQR